MIKKLIPIDAMQTVKILNEIFQPLFLESRKEIEQLRKEVFELQKKYEGMKYKIIYKDRNEKYYTCPTCGHKIKASDVEPHIGSRR